LLISNRKNWYKTSGNQLSLFEEFPEKNEKIEDIKIKDNIPSFLYDSISYFSYGFATVRFYINGKLWQYVLGNDIAHQIDNFYKNLKRKGVLEQDASQVTYNKFIPHNKRNEVELDRNNREPIEGTYKEFNRANLI